MIIIDDFINQFSSVFANQANFQPWTVTHSLTNILNDLISKLDTELYQIKDGVAIHKTATIETSAQLKAPLIIGENCFVGANALLRGGVYLDSSVSIGPSCEIKTSIIFSNSSIAHFNFIGDSIIGENVNFEAGAIVANHYNERVDKRIILLYKSKIIRTDIEKFGSLVGDGSKIGANAVLSPGTLLHKHAIIKRLELVDQVKDFSL